MEDQLEQGKGPLRTREGITVEDAPLLHSEESAGTHGATDGSDGSKQMEDNSWFNCSTTTYIGLILLVIMVVLVILSAFLQRYSSNTYFDIITPINGTGGNGTSERILLSR